MDETGAILLGLTLFGAGATLSWCYCCKKAGIEHPAQFFKESVTADASNLYNGVKDKIAGTTHQQSQPVETLTGTVE